MPRMWRRKVLRLRYQVGIFDHGTNVEMQGLAYLSAPIDLGMMNQQVAGIFLSTIKSIFSNCIKILHVWDGRNIVK